MIKLIKASIPGWEKDFNTEQEVVEELKNYICGACIEGVNFFVGEEGEPVKETVDEFIDPNDLDDLLSTACGCEFFVMEHDEHYISIKERNRET